MTRSAVLWDSWRCDQAGDSGERPMPIRPGRPIGYGGLGTPAPLAPASMTSPHPATPGAKAQATLFAKMAKVLAAVRNVQKRGRNEHFRYDYVQEADLMEAIREHLAANNVAFFASTRSIERQGDITTLHMEGTFACGDSGATFTVQGIGCGQDKADKGVYKAYTGAMKYVLWKTFLVSTNDDPERDDAPRPPQRPAKQPEDARARPSSRAARIAEGKLPADPADLWTANELLDELELLEAGHPTVVAARKFLAENAATLTRRQVARVRARALEAIDAINLIRGDHARESEAATAATVDAGDAAGLVLATTHTTPSPAPAEGWTGRPEAAPRQTADEGLGRIQREARGASRWPNVAT